MAYCDRCGAYIPDGWTDCPACGYNKGSEAAQQQAPQAEAHRAEQEKFAREEAEKRRARRQAFDKTWVENEQRRRREEELRRRQQEQEEQRRQEQERLSREQTKGGVRISYDEDGTKNVHVGDRVHVVVKPDGTKQVQVGGQEHTNVEFDIEEKLGKAGKKVREYFNADTVNKAGTTAEQTVGKLMPILSYLGPFCFLPLILGTDDFTRFHSKQGLRLFIASKILQAIGGIAFGSMVGVAVEIFQVLMAVIGIKNVVNGEKKKLPYIGG